MEVGEREAVPHGEGVGVGAARLPEPVGVLLWLRLCEGDRDGLALPE